MLSCCQCEKVPVGQLVELTEGGVLLRGTLMEYSDDDLECKNLVENFNFIKNNADNTKEKNSIRNSKFEESIMSMKEEGWH